jgi:tripartite-type tricarboxylate transporter receptor subunit TctC
MLVVRKHFLTLIASACVVVTGVPAQAQDEHYFDGKTITVYVGRTPGSGADLSVRIFVEFWKQHIPGNPTMVVRNVPGGGGTRVWNLGAEVADADGLHILYSPTSGAAAILKESGLRADFAKMPYIGGLMSPNMAYVRTDKVSSAEDLLTADGLIFGGQTPAHRFDLLGRLGLDAVGANYQYATGFPGAADVFNAVRRGEIDIQVASLGLYRFSIEPTLVKEGLAIPLWHNPAADTNGNLTALEVAADIPSYMEFYENLTGTPPSGQAFEMYKWLLPRVNNIVYAALLPPNTPAEIQEILRESFLDVTENPDYQAQELTMYGFNLPVIGADEGTAILNSLYDVPESVSTYLKNYIDAVR